MFKILKNNWQLLPITAIVIGVFAICVNWENFDLKEFVKFFARYEFWKNLIKWILIVGIPVYGIIFLALKVISYISRKSSKGK